MGDGDGGHGRRHPTLDTDADAVETREDRGGGTHDARHKITNTQTHKHTKPAPAPRAGHGAKSDSDSHEPRATSHATRKPVPRGALISHKTGGAPAALLVPSSLIPHPSWLMGLVIPVISAKHDRPPCVSRLSGRGACAAFSSTR
jgi:hypothetical protein